MAEPVPVCFVGGEAGTWRVERIAAVRGESLPSVPRIPVAAVAAGALALVASAVPALFGVAALVLSSSGQPLGAAEWLLLLLPVALSCWLLVGGVLLLAGRSWLAVAFRGFRSSNPGRPPRSARSG